MAWPRIWSGSRPISQLFFINGTALEWSKCWDSQEWFFFSKIDMTMKIYGILRICIFLTFSFFGVNLTWDMSCSESNIPVLFLLLLYNLHTVRKLLSSTFLKYNFYRGKKLSHHVQLAGMKRVVKWKTLTSNLEGLKRLLHGPVAKDVIIFYPYKTDTVRK